MDTPSTPVVTHARWRACAATAAAALALTLAGCGAAEPRQPATGTEPVAGAPVTSTSTAPLTAAESPGQLAATLEWSGGTDTYTLDLCVSIGEATIQGAGASTDRSLYFDANLLSPQDTGSLQVSRSSDGVVEYGADITSLVVEQDGTFDAAGEDATGQTFRLTGTCTLSW